MARPLSQWLHENYGLQADLHAVVLTDVLLADGRLRLFSSRDGVEPWSIHDNPLIGAPQVMVRTGTQIISVDLQGQRPAEGSPLDVSRDGQISPIDAILVINALNALNAQIAEGSVPVSLPNDAETLDVNRDGELSPMDAVLIINYLNAQTPDSIPPDSLAIVLSSETQAEGGQIPNDLHARCRPSRGS